MPKEYLDINVWDAARDRLRFLYNEFDKVYYSFSAGKDSSAMVYLALDIAREMGRLPVDVLFIDLEGQYKATIDHAEEIMLRDDVNGYWICLPIHLRNAVSMYHSQWICWDPEQEDKWIRDMPVHDCVINDPGYFPFFWFGMEFEQFVPAFGEWFAAGEKTTSVVAIRSDESLNRFRTIVNKAKIRYSDQVWTTKVSEHVFNSYPIYDWRTEDVWTAVARNGWSYNKIYDLMYWQGRTLHDMRICQPYGDDQRKGLDLFHACEPETWFKVVNRVPGANMGALYRGDSLLGNFKVHLPPGHTWKSYAIYLLESMPRYEAEHYLTKIKVFFDWWEEKGGVAFKDVPDAADPKLEAKRKMPSWRRVVKCLLRNDRLCRSLSFAQTKYQYKEYQELHEKYKEDEVNLDDNQAVDGNQEDLDVSTDDKNDSRDDHDGPGDVEKRKDTREDGIQDMNAQEQDTENESDTSNGYQDQQDRHEGRRHGVNAEG